MLIHTGTQVRLISETTTGLGTTTKEGSVQSDSIVATLWVDSVTAGSLTVVVNTLTDEGKIVELFEFPVVSSGTTNLLLKKSGVSLQRFQVVASYTGVCEYEVYVRAISGLGESNTKIVGSAEFTTSQISISTTPTILIASILTDRNGLVIKNWSTTADLYISEDPSKLPGSGYPLAARDALAMDVASGVAVYAVASTGTVDVRIAQAGG